MSKKAINRLKVVLAEKKLTSKWLAEKLGKNEATILNTLDEISKLLNISISKLINDK